jgi:hypothetical protein
LFTKFTLVIPFLKFILTELLILMDELFFGSKVVKLKVIKLKKFTITRALDL